MVYFPDTLKPVPKNRPFYVQRTSFWLSRIHSGSLTLLETEEPVNPKADVNSDGVVDEEDLSVVHKEYHKEKQKKKKG